MSLFVSLSAYLFTYLPVLFSIYLFLSLSLIISYLPTCVYPDVISAHVLLPLFLLKQRKRNYFLKKSLLSF